MGIKPVQNQFNGGEISPVMQGRFDLPAYQYSAEMMRNIIPVSEGYWKRRGGTHFVASAKETEGLLFKILPTPADAKILINNIEQNQCYCAYGDVASYVVSAPGYADAAGTQKMTENKELSVALVSTIVRYVFKITATPADAVVTINGQQRREFEAGANSLVEWNVAKSGYRTQSGTVVLSQNMTLSVNLKMRFSIQATPADAVVTINGQVRNYLDVDPGTEVSWSVAKDGYQTQSGTETVTASKEIVVSLSAQVPGQVMFESSTPGNYSQKLEAGRYSLLMISCGGRGWHSSGLKPTRYGGGTGSVFEGILRLMDGNYNIKIGEPNVNNGDCLFSDIITAGGGKNYSNGDGAGGILTMNSVSEIVSYTIAANGNTGRNSSRLPAPAPAAYVNTYGYGGGWSETYWYGGPGYVKLVYLGAE